MWTSLPTSTKIIKRRFAVKATLCVLALSFLAGCLPPKLSLLMSLIPDGTFTTLLGNMQGVNEPNRQKLGELAANNDWPGIAAFAQKNLETDPFNADWYLILGYAYTQMGDHVRANKAFAESVRLSPDDVNGWNLLAQSYRTLGQTDRAIRTLDTALRISQDSPYTYFLMGECFRDLKRYDRAGGYYEQALQRDDRLIDAWYWLGVCYLQQGRRQEYQGVVDQLARRNPEAAKQLASLGAK